MTFQITPKLKKCAAAMCAALMLSSPLSVEAHWLSSKQEKEIGDAAVAEFKQTYRTYENETLTHIQQRFLEWNPDKLWMYGTPGKKRGLEPILCSDKDEINAVSYGGGQVIVHQPMLDFVASRDPGMYHGPGHFRNEPYRVNNIYQMASLASVVGHEFGHWENEDMLRMHDKQMDTRLLAAMIPVGNVWAMLGVSAGSSLINAFNSRQMGFRSEQQADEKAMEYSEMVPEFSIGGEAIFQRRTIIYKTANGTIDKVNWLHPHSKAGKRFERALKYMEKSSRGFFKWKGTALQVDGADFSGEEETPLSNSSNPFERYLYEVGQIATAIKYDFARTRNFELLPENEVFTNGSTSTTALLLRGRGTDGKDHVKVVDTFINLPMKDAKAVLALDFQSLRDGINSGKLKGEARNLAFLRWFVEKYEQNLSKYGPRGTNASEYDTTEAREDDPSN